MDDDEEVEEEELEAPTSWEVDLYFTNANYQAKKTVFLLFINRQSYVLCVPSNGLLTCAYRSACGVVADEESI